MALNKTLGDLKTSIQTFLNRDDPEVVSNIPQFIMLAEQEFARMVKVPKDEGQLIYTATDDGDVVFIPEDLLSPIGVTVASFEDGSYSDPVSYTRVNGYAYFDLVAKGDNSGHYFAKYENSFQFYPKLKKDDIVIIAYHKDLETLKSDSDTSSALKYGYDLMLYWSLKHASVFMRDNEQEQFWTSKAQEALQTMEATFNELHWGGSPLQILGV